jgi:nitroreductase
MDAMQALMTRRSVRSFTEEPVTDAELDALLRAAMAAPSATNERPWRFVIAREEATRQKLAKATPFATPIAKAPVGIVVCGDKNATRRLSFWVIDCAAAIENLLLAARATGLGGVWIGVYPIRPFVLSVRHVIGTPRHVVPHSMLAIGHPTETPPSVDRFDEGFIHRERW